MLGMQYRCQWKRVLLTLSWFLFSQRSCIHPAKGALNISDRTIPQPPILQLSVEKLSRDGAFLMDAGSSIFAPFLTLQLAYMGLYKYFPKSEKKIKTTVLTAALLLSGIPAEVINRSMDTYSKMGEVFTDLCVYFFTFIFCHELLDYWGSEVP
ncbi:hypothetical protein H8959_021861 [Pygathrix nigripes]